MLLLDQFDSTLKLEFGGGITGWLSGSWYAAGKALRCEAGRYLRTSIASPGWSTNWSTAGLTCLPNWPRCGATSPQPFQLDACRPSGQMSRIAASSPALLIATWVCRESRPASSHRAWVRV